MAPLVTPFTSSFAIDWPAFDEHVSRLLAEGIEILIPADLVGEAWALDGEEKVQLFERTVRLSGGIGIKNLAEPSFALRMTARNARVMDNDTGNLFVNANIGVNGPFNNVDVTGFAHLLRGVVYIPESDGKTLVGAGDPRLYAVLDTNNASMRELFPKQSPLLANLQVDVAVMVDHDVFVRSRDANVEVYTDNPLRVGVNRTQGTLLVDGVLLSDRGEYRFQSRTFQIRQGAATFINTGYGRGGCRRRRRLM